MSWKEPQGSRSTYYIFVLNIVNSLNSSIWSAIDSMLWLIFLPFLQSVSGLSIYSYIHSFIHSSIHSFIHFSLYSFIHSFISHLLGYSLRVNSFICILLQFFSYHSFFLSFVYFSSFLYSCLFFHIFMQTLNPNLLAALNTLFIYCLSCNPVCLCISIYAMLVTFAQQSL